MKSFLMACALCLSSSASAALITYSYDNGLHSRYEEHDAVGLFTVDDQREGLVSVLFASEPATFSWRGYVPLRYDEVIATESRIHENGFESFMADGASVFLWLDLFWLDAGENIFHHLDGVALWEGASIEASGTHYSLAGSFIKVGTVQVPEPSTLALLSFGLLGFAAKRRLS